MKLEQSAERSTARSPATDLDAAMMNMNMTNVNMNMATGSGRSDPATCAPTSLHSVMLPDAGRRPGDDKEQQVS